MPIEPEPHRDDEGYDGRTPLGDAEDAFWNAIGAWLIAMRRATLAFWRPRIARFMAQVRALRRWLALALAQKHDGVIAEMTSVQGFLAPTMLSPYRLVAWVTMVISALFAGLWAWVAFVRLPAVKAELATERARAETATEANSRWRSAYAQMKARVDAGDRAQLAQHEEQQRVLVDAGRRAAGNETIRRSAARRQKELIDASRNDAGPEPFDGARWLQRRLEAEGDRGAGVSAGPADAAAGLAAGVLPEGH